MFGLPPLSYTRIMPPILYLDQNAWVAIARGGWDKNEYPKEHAALAVLVDAIEAHGLIVPLTFTNLYVTMKINDPSRRAEGSAIDSSQEKSSLHRDGGVDWVG